VGEEATHAVDEQTEESLLHHPLHLDQAQSGQ
jgi:hypothetical protein